MITSRLRTAALVLGAAVAIAPAAAQDIVSRDGRPVATISYADLDLGTPAGVARLNRRVRNAVDRLCDLGSRQGAGYRARGLECRNETLAAAQPQISEAIGGGTRYASARAQIMLAITR
jgi:UrcA family protein